MDRDDWGWADDDPDYLAARIRAVVDSMAVRWRGRPLADIEAELRRRLPPLGPDWPAEATEHLARRISDPHWHWKHPVQALDLMQRFHRRTREAQG
ncbi:MAG: hypothetical protein ACRDOY_01310 [Nocardioidaceae bacterium]